MDSNEMTVTLHHTTATAEFIVNNLSVGEQRVIIRDLVSAGLTAIVRRDLSPLQQTLQVAFSLAEASTIARVPASPAQNAAVQAHEGERVQAYLQRRYEAMRTIEEFTRRQQEFLPQYAGLYVAFYQGRVVDSDVDRAALAQRFYARYGNVPVCIAKPGETPETIRLATPHLKKS
jgi:hypothetical protein